MVERDDEAIAAGKARVEKTLEGSVARGKMSGEQRDAMLADLFHGTTSMNALAQVDLVIEAVFESMDVKKDVFGQLDTICKPGCVLASNTSYLDINQIAAMTNRPQDVIGMHFFSPANIMRLLEIVVAEKTLTRTWWRRLLPWPGRPGRSASGQACVTASSATG